MAGIGERLKEMMPGATPSPKEDEASKTGTGAQETRETQFHPVSQADAEKQEGVNTLGYKTGSTTVAAGEPATCNREFFTKVEDRSRMVERHEFIKEHVPVERQYVVETRFIGEREIPDQRREEVLGVEERIIEQAPPKGPCE
jgi:hypothetical protein